MAYWPNVSLVVLVIVAATCRTYASVDFGPSFHDNCADQNNKDFVCTVRSMKCADGNTIISSSSNRTDLLDDTAVVLAHDIRVEPYARAITRRAQQTYQLSVDISWQLPPNNSTSMLLAFMLEIEDTAYNRSCFYFDISNSHWNTHLIATAPRFHFTSESLFEFGEAYDIKLISLSKYANHTTALQKHVLMPQHPDFYNDTIAKHDCKRTSNPQASRWTGGFRRILVHPIARTIQVEFVGAPAHYCFEGYEVRLKDESGLELLHSAVVTTDSMHVEHFDNQTVPFGEYNFTGLEVDKYFIPSVIPIERSRDGRCLCPVSGTNPFDSRVVCSCIAADWNKVRIQRMEKPLGPASASEKNGTVVSHPERNTSGYIWTILLTIMLLGVSGLVFFLLYVAYFYYIRYRVSGKAIRIRFVTDRPPSPTLTTLSNSQAPLIHIARRNVLLVYSHDNMLHEKCVLAFAEYLRDVFGFDVHLDVWDVAEIERNVVDYISASILNADKVVVINSQGAYYHYRFKVQQQYRIERNEPEPLDDLFEKQIDQVLVHSSVVSARLRYTPNSFVLPPLSYSMQYVIPDNIAALLSSLTDSNIKNDPRIVSYSSAYAKLIEAVAEMSKLLESDPGWFGDSHRRVPHPPAVNNRARNEMDKLVGANRTEQGSENNDVRILQVTAQPKMPFESPEEIELIAAERSIATVSSGVVLDSGASADALETENFTAAEKYDSNQSNTASTSGQLNSFSINVSNPSGKPVSGDGHALHDSGFISEKDFTNT